MRTATLLFVLCVCLGAQAPVVVRVEPAPGAKQQPQLPSMDQLQAFQKALASESLDGALKKDLPRTSEVIAAGATVKAPKSYKPPMSIPLDDNAKKAVEISSAYGTKPNPPAAGKDGVVLFTFGNGLPTVVCAPLRLTTVELEPGETLTNPPLNSDQVQWDILPQLNVGGDAEPRTLIVIRPHDVGLEATLLITTNRRPYYLHLISNQSNYMARVAFEYPGATADVAWNDYKAKLVSLNEAVEAQKKAAQDTAGEKDHCSYSGSNYTFRGKAYFKPNGACDDGTFTYIDMPTMIHSMGAPVLMVQGPNGMEPVNYDVTDSTYVVHRIFAKAWLLAGSGRRQQKVEIDSPRVR